VQERVQFLRGLAAGVDRRALTRRALVVLRQAGLRGAGRRRASGCQGGRFGETLLGCGELLGVVPVPEVDAA